jgi:RNA polymerase sigma factor (sigma-70 family)
MKQWNDDNFESLLDAMQRGEDGAFDLFFKKHYDRLVRYARKRIGTFPLRTLDEEDVALSAMNSLFNNIRQNRVEAQSSVELWQILAAIAKRKLINHREQQHALKRGGGNVRGDSIWTQGGDENVFHSHADPRLDILPDSQIELLETTERLFQRLEDDKMRDVARLMLEGYRIDDIAERLNCVPRTINRKILRIRELWSEVLNND